MKISSYPLSPFSKALELAKTISDLGGNCSHTVCAAKMNKKMGGSFKDLISATVKYGLISNKKGTLTLTDEYKSYKLSYNLEEENAHLRILFLKPQLFQAIYEKYKDVPLPIDILEKALVKEFGVPEQHASRTTNYFINGARSVGLLGENNIFSVANESAESPSPKDTPRSDLPSAPPKFQSEDCYSVHIVGPSIDTKLDIVEISDLLIVDAVLAKVKSKLKPETKEKAKDENPQSPT